MKDRPNDDRPHKKRPFQNREGGDKRPRSFGKGGGGGGKPFNKRPPADQLYGLHGIREALNAGKQIDKVLVDKEAANPQLQALVARLREHEVPIQFVPRDAIERQASGRNHQGVIGYLPAITFLKLDDVVPGLFESGTRPLLVLLDGVTDVRNVGAIARSIEVLGGHALVLPSHGSARINADAVKTSAGALNHLPVCRTGHVKQAVAELQAMGLRVVALSEKAEAPLKEADLTGPTCLLLGDEGRGIEPALLKAADHVAFIPMQGQVGSLNVSVAAGISLYEVQRQRSGSAPGTESTTDA